MDRPWARQVDRFCHQYLQLEHVLDYPDGEYLKLAEVQDAIHSKLFAAEAPPESDPPAAYKAKTLKALVSKIEAGIDDWDQHGVSDDLMSSLTDLLSTARPPEAETVQQKRRVTYHLSALRGPEDAAEDARITLLENRSLISAGGTTGLRTWEAALHLGQYLCRNPEVAAGRRVLELGAGTGYLSILCARHLRARHAIASDGSDDVVHSLADNFFLNGLQGSDRAAAMDVKWGHALVGAEEDRWNGGRALDVVLGADITYDAGLISALIGTLADLFALYPRLEVLIAATQRNHQTFRVFLDRCQGSGLDVIDVPFPVPPREAQDGPFYESRVAIRICRISKPSR
ncbi:Uncharacterized protein ESCO_003419 [Escovopsis weberi]|uniref:Protein-lysine N-methyltransferase EFM3 n=1 Tax=Escovopsis weberi TaxID=150374 RepID=A0A0M8N994_ESCWE|nr:Uncharacterized protein ESCO_003419 [Escovopsis weberi]